MLCNLQVENLTKTFGTLTLFRDISFTIGEGQRVGLIAKNGAGKTTLLNIIAGKEEYDAGNILLRKDAKTAYLLQDPYYPPELTVLQACFYSQNETVQVIAAYEKAMADNDHAGIEHILPHMDRLKAWDYEQRAKQILSQLKITDFHQTIQHLSGGQLKRVALANVLITEPDLLILDEPTNHLDLEMTEWLEEYLCRSKLSLLMVTHDRYFLDRVCATILEIDQKKLYQYKGNYSYYLEKRQERIEANNAALAHDNNLFRKELEWMRRQPQARATKAKSRIDAFHVLEEKVKQPRETGNVKLQVKASYIGTKIFEAKHICKSYGTLKILDDFNYVFSRYEKMGIVGNNGTGKTTFIKMLTGAVPPDSGVFDIGETVKFGYYSQDGLVFDEQMKVLDVVQNIAEEISLGDGRKLSASQFLQHFLFTPETQYNYVEKLSGGERRRLYLCTVLIRNPNFLVLDEPTNDLDIVTLNILEAYLQSFQGCVIVVSHDRYFMDKVADHLLVFRGHADIKDFPGNYSDYREWKELQDKKERELQLSQNTKIPAKTTPENPPKKKLSFKEKQELAALEKQLEALEAEKKDIETALSSGVLLQEDLLAKSTRIGEVNRLIDAASERWMELSEKEG